MVAEFATRRKLIVDGLNALPGISCVMPKGAFYAFPNVTQLPIAGAEFADRMLNEANVAVLAGTAFGQYGSGYIRLSYANSQDNIRKGLERMSDLIDKL
jgi:aspartate/methionine/tyrosine aminotransferase